MQGLVFLVVCAGAHAQMARLVTCGIVGPVDSEHPAQRLVAVHWEPRFGIHPTDHYQVWLKAAPLAAPESAFALVAHAVPTSQPESILAAIRFGLLGRYEADLELLLHELGLLAPEESGAELAVQRVLAALADPRATPFPSATALGRANPVPGWALGETTLFRAPAGTVVSVKLTDTEGTVRGLVEFGTSARTRLISPGSLTLGAGPAESPDATVALSLVLPELGLRPLREQACRVGGLRLYRYRGAWVGPPPDDDVLFAQLAAQGKIEAIGPLAPFDFGPPAPAELDDPAAPVGEPLAYWAAAIDLLGQRGTLTPTLDHTVAVEGGAR